jgi:hypothetical protein
LNYPEIEKDKTLEKSYILSNLKKFKMDACDQKRYNDIIIYYTGHAYIGGGHKGSWVCRDGQGINLKDVTDIFKNLLEQDSFSLTIISDCCYSGQWIKDVNKIGI